MTVRGMTTPRCRSCGAPILWAALKGKPFPVDATPADNGNIELQLQPGGVYTARVVRGPSAPLLVAAGVDEPRYVSHFVTCPHASDWRKKGKSES